MERAGAFTLVPGSAITLIGITAIVSAVIAARIADPHLWITIWISEAVLAVAIDVAGTLRKARRLRMPLFTRANRRFYLAFSAPLLAGALLTAVAVQRAAWETLVPLWLILYGTAIITGGTLSIRLIPAMGICFFVLGALSIFSPPVPPDLLMAVGFGGIHILFGLLIARNHGG